MVGSENALMLPSNRPLSERLPARRLESWHKRFAAQEERPESMLGVQQLAQNAEVSVFPSTVFLNPTPHLCASTISGGVAVPPQRPQELDPMCDARSRLACLLSHLAQYFTVGKPPLALPLAKQSLERKDRLQFPCHANITKILTFGCWKTLPQRCKHTQFPSTSGVRFNLFRAVCRRMESPHEPDFEVSALQ